MLINWHEKIPLCSIYTRAMKQVTIKKGGFTLIEAVASIGLCSLTILAIVGALQYTVSMNTYSKNRLIAMNDARRVTEAIRTTADSVGLTGTGSVTGPNPPDWSTYLSSTLSGEAVQVTTSGTDPLDVTASVNWVEKGRTQTFKFVTKVTQR